MKKLFAFIAFLLFIFSAQASAQSFFYVYPEAANNYSSNVRNTPTYIDARVLAANTAETHTIPSGVNLVLFSSNCAVFYAKGGASAAVPAADVTDGTASELNPAAWNISLAKLTQITLIAPSACIVTMTWYK